MMKNTSIASKMVKMDVIVIENLFYSKNVSRVFDLKGSERNRMVNETKQSNTVIIPSLQLFRVLTVPCRDRDRAVP